MNYLHFIHNGRRSGDTTDWSHRGANEKGDYNSFIKNNKAIASSSRKFIPTKKAD